MGTDSASVVRPVGPKQRNGHLPVNRPASPLLAGRDGTAARLSGRSRHRRGYLPALDGLRAVAVVAVFAYHLGVPFLPGGFLGVDLFFVLSGFLITTLLVAEGEETGRIRIGRFWLRRARRLLPALIGMLTVSCAAAVLVGRDLTAGLRQQLLGAALYSSNWVQIATGSSYVQRDSPSLLTHLWSLAVEEQFYLLWPFVVILLLSFFTERRSRVLAVSALAVLSGIWMAVNTTAGADPTRIYVGTDTHEFGLLLGAALALALRRPAAGRPVPSGTHPRVRGSWVGLTGLAGVITGMTVLSDSSTGTFRGGLFLVDLCAVMLVAAAASGDGPVGRIFALPALTWVGRRSYAIYLWHWPIIVILERLVPATPPRWPVVAAATIATLAATEISYRLVERPIRISGLRGWLGDIAAILTGRYRVPGASRQLALAGAAAFAIIAMVAAIGVITAPQQSDLDRQLAAGQQAIAAHRSAKAAPTTPTRAPASGPTVPGAVPEKPRPDRTTAAGSAGAPQAPASVSSAPTPGIVGPTPSAAAAVSAIGDSLMVGAAPDLYHDFPSIDIDAAVARQWWGLPAVLTEHLDASDLASTVIIGLGTNGSWTATSILHALEPIGARTVILVSSYVDKPWQQLNNTSLAQVAANRPHTCVADWHDLAATHPQWIGPDGIHPSTPGRQAYADLLRRTVDNCH